MPNNSSSFESYYKLLHKRLKKLKKKAKKHIFKHVFNAYYNMTIMQSRVIPQNFILFNLVCRTRKRHSFWQNNIFIKQKYRFQKK